MGGKDCSGGRRQNWATPAPGVRAGCAGPPAGNAPRTASESASSPSSAPSGGRWGKPRRRHCSTFFGRLRTGGLRGSGWTATLPGGGGYGWPFDPGGCRREASHVFWSGNFGSFGGKQSTPGASPDKGVGSRVLISPRVLKKKNLPGVCDLLLCCNPQVFHPPPGKCARRTGC